MSWDEWETLLLSVMSKVNVNQQTNTYIYYCLASWSMQRSLVSPCGDSQDSIVGPWRKWEYRFNLDWRCLPWFYKSDNSGHCILPDNPESSQLCPKTCWKKLNKGRSAFPPWPQNNNVWKLIEIYINKDINSMFYPLNDNIKNIYFTQYI